MQSRLEYRFWQHLMDFFIGVVPLAALVFLANDPALEISSLDYYLFTPARREIAAGLEVSGGTMVGTRSNHEIN